MAITATITIDTDALREQLREIIREVVAEECAPPHGGTPININEFNVIDALTWDIARQQRADLDRHLATGLTPVPRWDSAP